MSSRSQVVLDDDGLMWKTITNEKIFIANKDGNLEVSDGALVFIISHMLSFSAVYEDDCWRVENNLSRLVEPIGGECFVDRLVPF